MREQIIEFLCDSTSLDEAEEIVLYNQLDEAFVGVVERFGMESIALYDYDKCIEIYMDDGGTYEDAVEHFGFNVIGTWAGDRTPVFLHLAQMGEDNA